MKTQLSFALAMLAATAAIAAEPVRKAVDKPGLVACTTLERLEVFESAISTRDFKAIGKVMDGERCDWILPGKVIFIHERKINGIVRFRLEGSDTFMFGRAGTLPGKA